MGPRDLALDVLCRFDEDPAGPRTGPKETPDWGILPDERDRALAVNLVQGVMRWRLRLDWIIAAHLRFPFSRLEPRVLNILRLAVLQITLMDRVPASAAVNEAVQQAKKGSSRHVAGAVNGILRQICRDRQPPDFPDRHRDLRSHLSVVHSHPEWLVDRWLSEWGPEAAEKLMKAGNRPPVQVVRVNRLRLRRDELLELLSAEGIQGEPTSYSPDGIALPGLRGGVERLRSFRRGFFQVQSEPAQLFAPLLGARAGERVLDLCSGLGGKTTHLAEIMGGCGLIVAADVQFKRLRALKETAERLGIECIHPVVLDALNQPGDMLRSGFDRVMVDAPCSGLGVISRHPDIKWNRGPEDIGRLASVQARLLAGASRLLRPGGTLFYGTCTVTREENEGVLDSLLASSPDLRLEDLRTCAPSWARPLLDEQGFLRTLPHVHGLDGFFGALLRRDAVL